MSLSFSTENLNCQHSLQVLVFSLLLDVCHLFTFVRPSKLSTCHWAFVMQGPACSPRFGRIQIQADSKFAIETQSAFYNLVGLR